MSEPRLNKGSLAEKIIRMLIEKSMTRAELAIALGIEPKTYYHDFDLEKIKYKNGEQKIPPRRTTVVYPKISGYLNYLSRRVKKKDNIPHSSFMELYKPFILYKDGKWEVTQFGIIALSNLDKLQE